MVQVQQLTPVFIYSGTRLVAPTQGMNAQEVLEFYSGVYPELCTATVSEPEVKGDEIHYTFMKSVGTKG